MSRKMCLYIIGPINIARPSVMSRSGGKCPSAIPPLHQMDRLGAARFHHVSAPGLAELRIARGIGDQVGHELIPQFGILGRRLVL